MNQSGKIFRQSGMNCFLYSCILFQFFFAACNNNTRIESDEALLKSDFIRTEKEHTYELYIPSGSKKCHQLTSLIILDPNGKGKEAIDIFIPAAEKYKFILVASNYIKNNSPDYISQINALHDDISAKYPVNDQLLLAGFSGGARMAITYANYNKVEGIISCGALAASEQIAAVGSTVFCLTGMADFNFIEAAQYLFRPENAPENLRLAFTNEMHTWPSSKEILEVAGYFFVQGENDSKKCLDFNLLTESYLKSQIKRSREFTSSNDYISAFLLIQNLAYVNKIHDSKEYSNIYNSIDYGEKLNDQLNVLKESIRFELQKRDSYYKELAAKDSIWWQHEINTLNSKIANEKKKYNKLAHKRIKAFLGIMCYSLVNDALANNNLETASRLLPVYEILEPENPDMFYFRALYSKRMGRTDESKVYLSKAIEAGYSEKERIEELEAEL